MKKQRRRNRIRRLFCRIAALSAAIALTTAMPVNWGRLGRVLSVAAAGLQQPVGVADLLCEQLGAEQSAQQTVVSPQANAGNTSLPQNGETLPDIPTVSPPLETPPLTAVPPPGEKGDGGKVIEQIMDVGNTAEHGIATLNRSGTAVDIAAALKRELTLSFADTTEPQVLILHTHTTEGYMTYDGGYYNAGDRNRTEDHSRNVCAVGEAIRLALKAHGVTAIHDTTVHDSPVYSGAYTRSAKTAEDYLKKYPTIRVVLDVHRDAVMQGDTDIVKPTAVVNGKKAAQMMLITGVVSTTELPHPQWQENLTFATHLQQALGSHSRHLMRPLNTVASRYNQHLSPGWVLVEVGSEGNTVEEAVYAGQLLGETLATLLK
ncbi:MAG: stage II sporulation protein P [Clostridia bacterium]|nr:stage II sporulation protein P [Clostridia bacterium]